MHLSFHPVWWWPAVLLTAVLVLLLVVRIYQGALAERAGRWRWAAFAMRLAALLLALAALLRPSVVFTETRTQSASLVLLYDRSRSMLVADAWDSLPRWQALNQILRLSEPELKRLAEVLEIRQFTFDGKISEAVQLSSQPAGSRSAIGDVLRESLRRVPGRVAAVVLLSDGANTSGTPPLSVARDLNAQAVRLYTVGFGQQAAAEAARDLALQDIIAGPTVFEKNRLLVRASLEARGFAGRKVNVRLLWDNSLVDTKALSLPRSDGAVKLELSHLPTVPGEHKVTLVVSELGPKKGELVRTNNRISTFVTVLKGGLRVLYLDGGLGSWEPTFVRIALDAAPSIELDYLSRRGRLDQDITALFDREQFDVFMIRELPRDWLPSAALVRLREAVASGAGFVMMGGRRSFGPGGYARTPVAEILPVEIHPGDPQIEQTGEPLPIRVVPTAQGLDFVMRPGEQPDQDALWQSLRPWLGGSAFSGLKLRVRVLARSPRKTPLIVAWDFGRGRAMAIAGDSTWQWARQNQRAGRFHRRFWRQVILWLARKEQAGQERIWVELARRRLAAGQGLELSAGAEDQNGNAVLDAGLEAQVTLPDGTSTPLRLVRHGDRFQGTLWDTDQAGDYEVTVSAKRQDKPFGHAPPAKFLVYEDDAELAAPSANLELLTQMAQVTGGRYVQPEQLPEFFGELRAEDLDLQIERLRQYRLWDNWPFLLLFVCLLSCEWGLRKFKGMV